MMTMWRCNILVAVEAPAIEQVEPITLVVVDCLNSLEMTKVKE